MKINIFRSSCANLQTLERRPTQAFNLLGLDADIERVTDYASIAADGIMSTSRLTGAFT